MRLKKVDLKMSFYILKFKFLFGIFLFSFELFNFTLCLIIKSLTFFKKDSLFLTSGVAFANLTRSPVLKKLLTQSSSNFNFSSSCFSSFDVSSNAFK